MWSTRVRLRRGPDASRKRNPPTHLVSLRFPLPSTALTPFLTSILAFSVAGSVDLVTDTDKACESLIFSKLLAAFPEHVLVGEETVAASGGELPSLTSAPTWYVDPVDGTTNFVHRYPLSCVSIGLCVGGEPTLGVVFNPISRELFSAVRGRGAFLNGFPIHVAQHGDDLKACVFATELGTRRDDAFFDAALLRIRRVAAATRSMRCGGSCALNMCAVAAGRLDAYFEYGLGGPWDYVAATVVLREAGGKVIDPSGAPLGVTDRRVLGGAPPMADGIAAILKDCPEAPGEPLCGGGLMREA